MSMKFRVSLYLDGYVDRVGNITEEAFIRELEDRVYTPLEIPKNCHVVDEYFDGVYWCSVEGTEIHSGREYEGFRIGDFCVATYPNSNNKLEDYYAEILDITGEHCKVVLYNGDTFNSKRIYGIYKDVCVNDLTEIY